jgi:hypothetical protein
LVIKHLAVIERRHGSSPHRTGRLQSRRKGQQRTNVLLNCFATWRRRTRHASSIAQAQGPPAMRHGKSADENRISRARNTVHGGSCAE